MVFVKLWELLVCCCVAQLARHIISFDRLGRGLNQSYKEVENKENGENVGTLIIFESCLDHLFECIMEYQYYHANCSNQNLTCSLAFFLQFKRDKISAPK